MNPFLDPKRAAPASTPSRLRGARRRLRHLAFMAGLGLGAVGVCHAVDVNSASSSQLEAVRGIGPKTAALIVKERQQGGLFSSYEDLGERVRGLGEKRLKSLRAAGLSLGRRAAESPNVIINTPGRSKGKAN